MCLEDGSRDLSSLTRRSLFFKTTTIQSYDDALRAERAVHVFMPVIVFFKQLGRLGQGRQQLQRGHCGRQLRVCKQPGRGRSACLLGKQIKSGCCMCVLGAAPTRDLWSNVSPHNDDRHERIASR